MAISRMQEPRQLQAGGGIITLQDPRQGYFLGKLVKKAVRGVKKIVKSPLGKMALLGGGSYLLGGALGGGGGLGNFKQLFTSGRGLFDKGRLLAPLVRDKEGAFSLGRAALTGLGATAVAAPFFMGGDDEEEEVVDVMDVAGIRNRARDYYRGATDTGLNFMPAKQFVQPNFYAAAGGRAMLNMGGAPGEQQAEQMLMAEFVKYKNKGGTLSFEQFVKAVMQASQQPTGVGMEQPEPVAMAANGGRMGKQEGGIMDAEASEMIDMGGMEKDYRETGGFVEMGGKERADDVPARLSKNEFVFTADAVRNAGGGDIDKGAEVMENLMNNLEAGGEVSEDSQGLEGAQRMYDQQQMLQSRIA
jgi:hypothetical protein